MTVQTKDSPPDRAAEYLRRIARLTGAKQTPEGYLLKSGNRDFLVDSKFVRVLSHRRKSTCFFCWERLEYTERRNSRVCAAPIEEQSEPV